MLSYYVGQDVFLKGVSIYLREHLFGNTTSKDLWNGIQTAAGGSIDITNLMNNWVSKVRKFVYKPKPTDGL
jgi:aminopeptidase 2